MIGVKILCGLKARMRPGLHRETWLAIVDIFSDGFDSDVYDGWQRFATGVREFDKLISMISTFGAMGSRGGR